MTLYAQCVCAPLGLVKYHFQDTFSKKKEVTFKYYATT